jgi:phage head maturation protease
LSKDRSSFDDVAKKNSPSTSSGRTGEEKLRASASPREPHSIRFAGYAAVFDRVDHGGDVVRRGAFGASLRAARPVPLLWQHWPGAVVGVIETLAEDARGLRVVARVTHRTAAGLGFLTAYRRE